MMLEIKDLCASYGDLPALRNISLQADVGQIVALIGPNGAGKSTLLRTIVGLHRPTTGAILLGGQPIHKIPPHQIIEHGIALVPEGRRLFGGMTVLENLQVGAYSARAHKTEAQTIQQVFEIFPVLAERRASLARTLSGGQQQMLAIGRALVASPRLLLLDEPSLGLAPLAVKNIFGVVKRINHDGTTVLLVEQNARTALELAHDAYILEQGCIVGHNSAAAMLKDEQVRHAYLGYGGKA